uniref:Uncharacterized protein n=1 Tax=Meloidogyne enterolobii TaxID=390850 RepID=A0A6V7TTL0_MELEN|nr:unnamed protein product [Meloidogyne enterolobii]
MREYQQKKKNVQSDNNEGTSFVNPQTGDFSGKEEVECYNDKDGQNQIEIEDPNKILEEDIYQIDLNKKNVHFDLNEMPEDEEVEDF